MLKHENWYLYPLVANLITSVEYIKIRQLYNETALTSRTMLLFMSTQFTDPAYRYFMIICKNMISSITVISSITTSPDRSDSVITSKLLPDRRRVLTN